MKANIYTGLLTKNKVEKITEGDNLQLANYLDVLKAFAKLTYESVYVIDYAEMKFEYVSPNPLFLCGYSPEEVMQMGYEFYFKTVPEKDLHLLDLINEAGFDFFQNVPQGDKKEYSISYDFNLVGKNGKSVLVNHKLTPLFLNQEGKMWKAMCVVSISPYKSAGNVVIQKQGSNEIWELNLQNRRWVKSSKPELSEKELLVLRFYAQGLTIGQIAEKIFVAPDTVKYYRRRIFENFKVNNIVEALSYAVNNKII